MELDHMFNNMAMKKRCVNLFPFPYWNGCNLSYRMYCFMLTEHEQAKADSDQPKMVVQRPALPC